MNNNKREKKMKTTKGKYSPSYNITINNSVYEVEQREDNNSNKEWKINLLINNGVENQDTRFKKILCMGINYVRY